MQYRYHRSNQSQSGTNQAHAWLVPDWLTIHDRLMSIWPYVTNRPCNYNHSSIGYMFDWLLDDNWLITFDLVGHQPIIYRIDDRSKLHVDWYPIDLVGHQPIICRIDDWSKLHVDWYPIDIRFYNVINRHHSVTNSLLIRYQLDMCLIVD